jgi:hypothetical protein
MSRLCCWPSKTEVIACIIPGLGIQIACGNVSGGHISTFLVSKERTHLYGLSGSSLKMNVRLFLNILISVRFAAPPDLWQSGGKSASHGVPSRGAHKLAYYCKLTSCHISAVVSNELERMDFSISSGKYTPVCLWSCRCQQLRKQQFPAVQANYEVLSLRCGIGVALYLPCRVETVCGSSRVILTLMHSAVSIATSP